MEKRGGFSRASGATTLKALSMVVVLILSVSLIVILFAPFDNFVLLSFWSFCSSFGHFFRSFVIFLAVFVLLALVTNDRHLWIFVLFLLPVQKSLITAATHPSKFHFVFSR